MEDGDRLDRRRIHRPFDRGQRRAAAIEEERRTSGLDVDAGV